MMSTLFLFLFLMPDRAQDSAAINQAAYVQTYTIFLKAQAAGNERVSEHRDKDGNTVSESEHEIFVTDGLDTKRMAFITATVLAKGNFAPIRYFCKFTSGKGSDSVEINIKNGRASRVLNRGGQTVQSSSTVTPDALLLDFNVYHHYDQLLRRYDLKRAGRQVFHDFIALIGSEIELALTLQDQLEMKSATGSIPIRKFKIEFVGLREGIFSVDNNGRLVQLQMPDQELEVVRSDLVPPRP